ncbi:IS3 family transposase [Listeria booriae]|uniref:IS3 family transposase n=1 Tax=Listeria booriae TaxID=1552123 RepID=A0A7X0XDZ9_9LIST|nr:IS3 family transposase [Listeria booriae]MBC1492434.1 IS3 family transposase [Listeria booriae]MBC1504061.1 IS3 family transposase [Listeria booriae]MBC1524272.1 IS3 family transposase [Listeria booriae]MBC1531105.1 IS3 family transposase [Listeria booriae]MBC6135230.1 IS3 family transposase [Listeria booriae]
MSIKRACEYFNVSRSGYYAFVNRSPSSLTLENEVLSEIIRAIYFKHKGRYGSRRIQVELKQEHQLAVSRKRIGRLLRKQGLYTKGKRRKYKKQAADRCANPNLIKQNFHANEPNQTWFRDISYVPTQEGMLYCSVFIDCCTLTCAEFAIREHLRDSLVIDSLEVPLHREKPKNGLLIHTDQGSQYTGHRFYEYSRMHHFVHSQSWKGNPYDNAVMESFFKSFKREILPNKPFQTKSQAKLDIIDYLENHYN